MPSLVDDAPLATYMSATEQLPTSLPFPPVTKQHILNCSYHSWWSRYRTITPKARLIPLSQPFLQYLRSDGIILPSDDDDDEDRRGSNDDNDSGFWSSEANTDLHEDEDEEEEQDVAAEWRDIHNAVGKTIAELGGRVMPKLNWSAPKDATWINANSMECRAPSDIYLLLKSSDFVTHDLEHAFDGTVDEDALDSMDPSQIPYHLVLRKHVGAWNPSVEFRCFVRNRRLIGLCQRDLNHFDFLFKMASQLRSKIQEFFDVRLRDTFPDANFVFDVYIPPPHDRVWLVDVNPWAPRTDPLLFSWLELLEMDEPPAEEAMQHSHDNEEVVRLPIRLGTPDSHSFGAGDSQSDAQRSDFAETALFRPGVYSNDDEEEADEELWQPEFRLIKRSDPEAYSFSTPQYSAHKLPKDVVDASQSGEGLMEFARDWQNILDKRRKADAEIDDSSD